MITENLSRVGFSLAFVLAMVFLIRVMWLIFRWKPAAPDQSNWVLIGSISAGVGAFILGYFLQAGRLVQPAATSLLWEDQMDTIELSRIEDRDERVTAFYKEMTDFAHESQSDLRRFLDNRGATYPAALPRELDRGRRGYPLTDSACAPRRRGSGA